MKKVYYIVDVENGNYINIYLKDSDNGIDRKPLLFKRLAELQEIDYITSSVAFDNLAYLKDEISAEYIIKHKLYDGVYEVRTRYIKTGYEEMKKTEERNKNISMISKLYDKLIYGTHILTTHEGNDFIAYFKYYPNSREFIEGFFTREQISCEKLIPNRIYKVNTDHPGIAIPTEPDEAKRHIREFSLEVEPFKTFEITKK